ncbi:2'-5' RNA ligase family protein [Pedobacter frigoris]|uniref:2'-5' RNA ligase family protein n=1 Tax=Pedobacter frigoris TaxID=2571272 RepID=A0A4U1CIK2_9SPHI|nr:2'-5' RNA ligase family protein [Pedobacter frigoris]TKC07247.1 2'-5' RNA ligase family protein [Pedobacter frigoris]
MESLFFVAILPPVALSSEIDEIRKQCSIEYQVYSALKPPVHITLIPPFKLDSVFEARLITDLEHCRNFQSFEQELNDFDGFPPGVVFIVADKNPGITYLHKILRVKLKKYLKTSSGSITPHITIAYRDVLQDVYERIIEVYSRRSFRASFNVDKFVLLKHNGKKWNLVKEFESRPQEQQYTMNF